MGRILPLLFIAILLGAALVVFYGPDVSGMGTVASLLLIPASLGAFIAQVTDPKGEMSPIGCFVWPTCLILALITVVWLLVGEGAICIAMILPLWLPAAIAGAIVQTVNRRRRLTREDDASRFQAAAWLTAPLALLAVELLFPEPWTAREVARSVVIDASAARIWPALVTIPAIGPNEGRWTVTQNLLNVPRPVGARLIQENGGLVRKAEWQRGIRFEERITDIAQGRQICWQFRFPDASIQRETDHHISPDGAFLKIERGCYDLENLGDGKTRVTLTTRYRMRARLGGYFAAWGELLLGDVQSNVLSIVAGRSGAAGS